VHLPQRLQKTGHYVLKHLIGAQSFATAWRTDHELFGLQVTVNFVNRGLLKMLHLQMRFVHEINCAKQLDYLVIANVSRSRNYPPNPISGFV
jgi:hypothetical protein